MAPIYVYVLGKINWVIVFFSVVLTKVETKCCRVKMCDEYTWQKSFLYMDALGCLDVSK